MNSPIPVFIPEALKALDQWLVWKLEDRGGKPSKVPYCVKSGCLGKSNDPTTWCDFSTALAALRNGKSYDGIGFAFHEGDGLTGIDVDYPWGSPIATAVREKFQGTYCERSPSEKLRIFCRGKPGRCGKGTMDKAIEVYDHTSPRYLTVTGQWVEGTARDVTDQQAALDWLHERYFKPKEEPKPKKPKGSGPELTLGDQEIIDRARAARNGAKFATLFYGSWEAAGYPSQSEADAALCSLLAFWARDEGQIDRIFRQSALMREKWDEQHHADGRTYGQATIERALGTVTETYRPGDHREKPSPWGADPPIEAYADDPECRGKESSELPEKDDHWPRLEKSDEAEALDSDRANAVCLARVFGQQLLHVEHMGWHTWTGTHWRRSDEEAVRIAAQLSRAILKKAAILAEEASQEASEERREILAKRAGKLFTCAHKSESRARVDAALWFARALLNIHIEELNRDLYALNVQNGVIELHTGELRKHRQTDFITRCCPVAYDSKAEAPKWGAFLRRIFADDVAVIDFVQRAAGYSLTGDIGEQCLFILHGSGANGKSVLLEVLGHMLGAYAKQAAPDLLLAKTQDRHPTEIADLFGSRLVTAIETSEGRRLAEALVKQMTGGDKMKARFMRQDFFEFDATHKLWLATNHKPQVRGTDYAIWRRIRLIPFEVTIPKEEQVKGLAGKLLAEEAPGILAWMVRGCLAWQREGLTPPSKVIDATEAYREEMNVLAGFLDECCEINQDPHKTQLFTTTAKELYEVYKQWCDRNGEHPETQRSFGMRLTERGLEREKGRYGWSWKGIRVLPQTRG